MKIAQIAFLAGLMLALVPAFAAKPASAAADLENVVFLKTKDGTVIIKLRPDLAPKHVERIKKLTREGFYDGIVFHRVIDGFMAQTGDPTGTGMGGSDYPDVKAEFTDTPFVRGTVGAARSQDPDSANSQFFICFDDASFLNGKYTVWGEVIDGMDVVDKIKKGDPQSGAVQGPDKIVKMEIAADSSDAAAKAKAAELLGQ
ncbi:peptidylprolyl isomerase [Methyloligella sp. 2.7D]|uniref:peptidylprolyl isomerase n=1 Tax=unclassified Methyloligella TaxID=2625955 RepID=UPI00157C0620|nr:peptidylprolyl isomerase [Methyloligella sp. GL2]QKP77702.1 peptidylprolyl isomerase [Methyloligella sp. GL2]